VSLKKKIALSFLVSAGIILVLSAFLSLNFSEIKKETAFLEATDTIRSRALHLRRHEKNYFLYDPVQSGEESRAIAASLESIEESVRALPAGTTTRGQALQELAAEYRRRYGRIERLLTSLAAASARLGARSASYARVQRLAEAHFPAKPLEAAVFFESDPALGSDDSLAPDLRELDAEIAGLRKTGEALLLATRDLDRDAREKVDGAIRVSQVAIYTIYPLFIIVGFAASVLVTGSVVKRLHYLARVVDETGRGQLAGHAPAAAHRRSDEVDLLIGKFYAMEQQLHQREKELLQSKKLAAIGTLAAGVAHELNNPLSNIATTAQRLHHKAGSECPPSMRKGLDDIFDQSMRIKGIVGDLLEFGRRGEPRLRPVELKTLIAGAFRRLGRSRDTAKVRLTLECKPERLSVDADAQQMERVFLNLFANAIDAISSQGELRVIAEEEGDRAVVRVRDTGEGIAPELQEKIFDPFFTTKDHGTGLGLAIAFNILQKHRGEIAVESAQGIGTTFTLSLPKGRA
jgi:two-component system NtrC family sensor kinase